MHNRVENESKKHFAASLQDGIADRIPLIIYIANYDRFSDKNRVTLLLLSGF